MRSLSENIAQIVRKQSSRPGARLDDIITYEDLSHPLEYDSLKYSMDLITKEKTRSVSPGPRVSGGANTVYDLLRHHSEPDSLNTVGLVEEDVSHEIVQSCQDVKSSSESLETDPQQRSDCQVNIGQGEQ